MNTKQHRAPVWNSIAARPFVLAVAVCYALFVALTFLGAGRWGFWFATAWPYAFLLALQDFVGNPSGLVAFVGAYIFGLVLVTLFSSFVQRVRFLNGRTALSVALAALLWYFPLGALTLAAQGAAHLLGWSYGE